MQTYDPLHWEISKTQNPVEPQITFFREVKGHGNIRTKPFTKADLIEEIHIKQARGDMDIAPWKEALEELNHYH